jgi:hypothetical protein
MPARAACVTGGVAQPVPAGRLGPGDRAAAISVQVGMGVLVGMQSVDQKCDITPNLQCRTQHLGFGYDTAVSPWYRCCSCSAHALLAPANSCAPLVCALKLLGPPGQPGRSLWQVYVGLY